MRLIANVCNGSKAEVAHCKYSERHIAVRRLFAGCPQSAASWGELKEDGNVGPDLFAGHSQAHAGRGSIDLSVVSTGPDCGGPARGRPARGGPARGGPARPRANRHR